MSIALIDLGQERRRHADGRISATSILAEIGLLAVRGGEADSLARTISMTTELQLVDEADVYEDDREQERALIL